MHERMVILGAGNAGVSLAARLRRLGHSDVTIVDSRPVHRYRPLLNYVGVGLVRPEAIGRAMSDVIPRGVRLVGEDARSVDMDDRQVTTTSGAKIGFDTLILATGLEVGRDLIPGWSEARENGWAVSTFEDETASAVWDRVCSMRAGTAVFTVPPEPAPCAATALKPLFMACDHWRRSGVLQDIQVHLVLPGDRPLDVVDDGPNDTLERLLKESGVHLHRSSTVTGVDHVNRTVEVGGDSGSSSTTIGSVDLAHVVPHYRAPRWLADSDLARGELGRVDVDRETLGHLRLPHVWALGDVAELGIASSGGGLRPQVEVLAHNVTSAAAEARRYDGYTVMPVTVDRRRLMLIEVDRAGRPAPTTRLLDLTKPRRSTFLFDRFVLPQVYYRRILRGKV